jgi:hypothetical protein
VKTFLFRSLILPLGAAAIVSMLLSLAVPEPWRSLLVNLAATFLGSIITVFFVDAILRRDEEQRWKKFQGHAGKQISILAIATASSVRSALALPPPERATKVPSSAEIRQMIIALIEEDLLLVLPTMEQMDQNHWRIFARNLQGAMRKCELLLILFGPKVDAEIAALVLDLYEKAREALTAYEIIPDLLGVPFDQLKPNRRGESMVPYVRAMLHSTMRDVEQLLRICASLLRAVGNRFPERN